MLARVKRRRPVIGPAILVVGILLCLSAQYYPWWAINATVDQNGQALYCQSSWTTVFPSGTYFTRCAGPEPPAASPGGQQFNVPSVAAVAAVSADASLVAGVLAAVVILLSVVPRPGYFPRPGLAAILLVVGVLAAVASFAGAAYFMEELPHAWQSDNYTYQTGNPLQPSFSGSNEATPHLNQPSITESWTWGPTTGWYLAWGSGAVILIGSALSWRESARTSGPASP
jgi:hypothetical protein